jgi:GTP-binding protein
MDGLTDQESVQLITNHFMKSIDFIKGAVSMDTLPEKVGPEIAFIGRSNVGKSSLINMICNRKGLAYTSKTPGKTSGNP